MAETINLGASGAGLGFMIGGPLGAGIGGAIGAGVGFVTDLFGGGNKASARIIQARSDKLNAETAVLETGIRIQQTEADISAYDAFISAFPNYADLQKNTFEAQSRGEFRSLMNNFAMGNVSSGATGRTGGSFGMVAQEAQNELIDFTGEDMKLGGGDGGRYQMAGTELNFNLTNQEKQAKTQREILNTSLGTLGEMKDLYEHAAKTAGKDLKKAKHAKKTWWNPFD
jgi:hypothetical protein